MHRYEKLVLKVMASGSPSVQEMSSLTKLPEESVLRALRWLEEKGAVAIASVQSRTYSLTSEGRLFLERGFPEQILLSRLSKGARDFTEEEKRIGIPWALKNGWIKFNEKKEMAPTPAGLGFKGDYPMRGILKRISENALFPLRDGEKELLGILCKRGSLIVKDRSAYSASLTESGRRIAAGVGDVGDEVSGLDREIIMSGRWKEVGLARYDTKAPVGKVFPGKRHPLMSLNDKVRRIFSEMGFEEMEGEPVETAFWNFDALFQPQDHPARELADTFYLEGRGELPEKELVSRVAKAHEKGWNYKWDPDVAKALVLKTHNTAVSARYVAKSGGKPSKYFCVERVYRNEQTDFKHLAEFYQVDGIVIWEEAKFTDLLGLIKEFYRKLGFERIRFRPSYFPYTEPSLEVEVYFEERKEWLELGGAGIFRPEVSIPLCGKYPVLAWGLGLERPLMLKLGIDDIRTFYRNDLGWLRSSKRGF